MNAAAGGAKTVTALDVSEDALRGAEKNAAGNGMENIEYDFETYPMSGFRGDAYTETFLNNEYMNRTWYLYNEDDIPMVGLNITDYLPHGLYQEFGRLCWDYAKHFSRDLETGEVIYNPFVK